MSDTTASELPNAARDGRLSYAIFQLARARSQGAPRATLAPRGATRTLCGRLDAV